MELLSSRVRKALEEEGVNEIYHANSVLTACSFLSKGKLLSRGAIESEGLFQTSQKTDDLDKGVGIWFDIFLDSDDNHKRSKLVNFYGPVLFIFDTNIVRHSNTGKIWVTKMNPSKCTPGDETEPRWFKSVSDLKNNFRHGDFGQMLVLRHCGGSFDLKGTLKKIIIDDPNMKSQKGGLDYLSGAVGALRFAMTLGGIDVPIQKRKCDIACKCQEYYSNNLSRSKKMFAASPV